MNFLVQCEILAIGIGNLTDYLQKLPVRLSSFASGKEAVSSLKNTNFSAVVCNWNLIDMPDGKFLRGLKLIKPDIHSIAIVDANDFSQEIAARASGSSAVISENITGEELCKIISNILHIPVYAFASADSK